MSQRDVQDDPDYKINSKAWDEEEERDRDLVKTGNSKGEADWLQWEWLGCWLALYKCVRSIGFFLGIVVNIVLHRIILPKKQKIQSISSPPTPYP